MCCREGVQVSERTAGGQGKGLCLISVETNSAEMVALLGQDTITGARRREKPELPGLASVYRE